MNDIQPWSAKLKFLLIAIALCMPWRQEVYAQQFHSPEGNWEGVMTMIHGRGLKEQDFPPQVWRMVVRGDTVRMFIADAQNRFTEVKPGGFKMARHLSNTLVYSIDSAGDESWIETEAWLFIETSPDTLLAMIGGAVKNPRPMILRT